MTYKKILTSLLLLSSLFFFSGFWSGQNTQDEKAQAKIERQKQSKETLQLLYKYAPEAKKMVQNSYGYATFGNFGINVILFSAEGGTGLAHNNKTGKTTYMNMASAGLGLGLGVKDFRVIFLFENKSVYDDFINYGWEANAQADIAAKAGDNGGALNGAITVAPGMRIYKLTQNGLALQATIQGTKYWKDGDLN